MKKLLLLTLLISITVQINGQHLFDLENEHERLTQEAELQRKDKITTTRDVYQRDSTYRYDDTFDNLQRRWIYDNYNFANNYTSFQDNNYEGNMQWSPNFRRVQEFNPDGSVSSYISEEYEDGEWVNSSRVTYEYNDNGFRTLNNRESWDDNLGEWRPSTAVEYTFTADNILLTQTNYFRDGTTGELEVISVTTYTSVNGVITEWLREGFGIFSGKVKTEVFFHANNERDYTQSYDWNEDTSSWDPSSRYIYPVDINAAVRVYQSDEYSVETGEWDPQRRSIYTDYADIGEVQYLDEMRSDDGQPDFYLDDRSEYFWSNNPLNAEVAPLNEIDIIIPNPFEGNPQITINDINENTVFVLHDIHGNTLFEKNLQQSNSFSINKILPNGMYIINLIQANNVVKFKKIIKVR